MHFYPASTMPERDETKWKVIVIFRKEACVSSLLKGKLPAKLGIPVTACHVTSPHSPCFQLSRTPLALIRGGVRTIDKANNISYVFFLSVAHISVRHIYFVYSSTFNVSTAHKKGDITVRVKTIRRFTTNIKHIIL
jgi:hypothetical protein